LCFNQYQLLWFKTNIHLKSWNYIHIHLCESEYDFIWFDFWCLTSLSTIFQLYHGDQF